MDKTPEETIKMSRNFKAVFATTVLMDIAFVLAAFGIMLYATSSVLSAVTVAIAFSVAWLLVWCIKYAKPGRTIELAAPVLTCGVGLIGTFIVAYSMLGGWWWMAAAMAFVFATTMFILVRDLDDHLSLGVMLIIGGVHAIAIIGGAEIIASVLLSSS